MQIEINLLKLERGLREGRVKVTRGGKTFYRKQRIGVKESERKYVKNYYKDRFKSYDSLSSKIDMSKDRIIKQSIDKMVEYSGESGCEAITTFSIKDNKLERITLKKGKETDAISLPRAKFNLGSIHTHPNTSSGGAFNSPSEMDLFSFILREKEKFMGVQAITKSGEFGDTWIIVKTDIFELKEANHLFGEWLKKSNEKVNELRPKLREAFDYENVKDANIFFTNFDDEVARSHSKLMKFMDESKMFKIYRGKLNSMEEIRNLSEDNLFKIIMERED